MKNSKKQKHSNRKKQYQYRALISVSKKTGIALFAGELEKLGVEIVSTGGTAKEIREAGVPVTDVSEVTGHPECFDGRVKTLHPKIAGGILFRGDVPEDVKMAKKLGIKRIDLVVVDFYPFQQIIAKSGVSLAVAIEGIDVGGPNMVRAAAKNYPDATVVCDPADRNWVIKTFKAKKKLPLRLRLTLEQRLLLAQKVFTTTANYDGAISRYLGEQTGQLTDFLSLTDGRELAYAENRCQNPAHLFSGGGNNPLAISKFQVVAGNPSYIALADASSLVSVMCLMVNTFMRFKGQTPKIAIAGKHGNPCGAGISWHSEQEALLKALMGDSLAVMGGELITNFPITEELGQAAYKADTAEIGREYWGLDEILAPAISPQTIKLMSKKEKRRLLINPALTKAPFPGEEWTYRELHGGDWLRQRVPWFVLSYNQIISWTNEPLPNGSLDDLIIAFACCWRATSNTVALAKNGQLITLGCGQQDRIACVRLALDRANRAGHSVKGSVFASDAFFPYATSVPLPDKELYKLIEQARELSCIFGGPKKKDLPKALAALATAISRSDRREGPELLRDAGCIGGVVPADGKNLAEVQEFFRQAGMSVAFVAPENRGFAKH